MKSVEEAYADRLLALSNLVPWHQDAFVSHLSVLQQARIDEGHDSLIEAITAAAAKLEKTGQPFVSAALNHIESEMVRVSRTGPCTDLHGKPIGRVRAA